MTTMFEEWLAKNQPSKNESGHRYYRTALAIQDRFKKSMVRAHEKLAEFDLKAELKKAHQHSKLS